MEKKDNGFKLVANNKKHILITLSKINGKPVLHCTVLKLNQSVWVRQV